MSYTIGDIRRWVPNSLATANAEVMTSRKTVAGAHRALAAGRDALDEGWDGVAAEAVLDAAAGEMEYMAKLVDGAEDLAEALARADDALAPAVEFAKD